MTDFNATFGPRIDAVTSDVIGLLEVLALHAASARKARNDAPAPWNPRGPHDVVQTIKRHPILAIAAALGIVVVAARSLRGHDTPN